MSLNDGVDLVRFKRTLLTRGVTDKVLVGSEDEHESSASMADTSVSSSFLDGLFRFCRRLRPGSLSDVEVFAPLDDLGAEDEPLRAVSRARSAAIKERVSLR